MTAVNSGTYGVDNLRAEKAATGTEHGECLRSLWLMTREPAARHHEVVALAERCIAYANEGSPCELNGQALYPLRKFSNARWNERSAKEMSGVFAAYVANGFINVNASWEGAPALTWAIRRGNLHTCEHLVQHGADLARAADGEEFIAYVAANYGRDFPIPKPPEEKAEAIAKMLAAKMSLDIKSRLGTDVPAATPRRQQRRVGI